MGKKARAARAASMATQYSYYNDDDDYDDDYTNSMLQENSRQEDLRYEGSKFLTGSSEEMSVHALRLAEGWGGPHWFASDDRYRLEGMLERYPDLTQQAMDELVQISDYDIRGLMVGWKKLTETQIAELAFQDLFDEHSNWLPRHSVFSRADCPQWLLGLAFQYGMRKLQDNTNNRYGGLPDQDVLLVSLLANSSLPVVARAQATWLNQVDVEDWHQFSTYGWFISPENRRVRGRLRREAETLFPEFAGLPDLMLIEMLSTQEVSTPEWGAVPDQWKTHAELIGF